MFFPIHIIQPNHPFSHDKSALPLTRTTPHATMYPVRRTVADLPLSGAIRIIGSVCRPKSHGMAHRVCARYCRQLFMQTCCHTFIISGAHVVENRTSRMWHQPTCRTAIELLIYAHLAHFRICYFLHYVYVSSMRERTKLSGFPFGSGPLFVDIF